MTSTKVVETSVTNNSSSQNYPHPDDHTIQNTDTPTFKPYITKYFCYTENTEPALAQFVSSAHHSLKTTSNP